jgi:hypothetical protein
VERPLLSPPPSPQGFPPSKYKRWGLLPIVANPSSTAQRGGDHPFPVVRAGAVKKNTGVHAGIFFCPRRHPCRPAPPPPQRGVLSPPRGSSSITLNVVRPAATRLFRLPWGLGLFRLNRPPPAPVPPQQAPNARPWPGGALHAPPAGGCFRLCFCGILSALVFRLLPGSCRKALYFFRNRCWGRSVKPQETAVPAAP